MKCLTLALAALFGGAALTAFPSETKRFLYMSTPDGAQMEGRSGNGILVFDIDNGHQFVKRIGIPSMEGGVRGMTGNARNHCLYYSTSDALLGCFDVEAERVLWESRFDRGCDRSSITPDGKKIYVPTGWWYRGEDSGFLVVNAQTGKIMKRLAVGPGAHNSIVSLDGKYAFLGTETMLTLFDASDDRVIRHIKDVGERGVFPYCLNSRNTVAYVCLGNHVGFDVVDLENGRRLHRVFAGEDPIANRTHGVGLTPDESELWISDQVGKKLFIFDATQMPPVPKDYVALSMGGHGWVTFSLDGKYAYCHTPDVFDVQTKRRVALLKDEQGELFASSKFLEVHLADGKVVAMGNEFGLGRRTRP